jgi:hypothetical protein
MAEELAGADELDLQASQQLPTVPRGGLRRHDAHGLMLGPVRGHAGGQRIGAPVVHLEALGGQPGGDPAHRRDHQVSPLAVPALRRQLGPTLHHQHPVGARAGGAQRAQGAIELVAQHPTVTTSRTPSSQVPGR